MNDRTAELAAATAKLIDTTTRLNAATDEIAELLVKTSTQPVAYRLYVAYETNSDDFWCDAVENLGRCPENVRPLIEGDVADVRLTREEYVDFVMWASELTGWDTGNATHPIGSDPEYK